MVTLVIDKIRDVVTVKSKGFEDSYTLVSCNTQCVAGVMMYIIRALKHDNKISIDIPVEITTKIVIDRDCISNTYQNN